MKRHHLATVIGAALIVVLAVGALSLQQASGEESPATPQHYASASYLMSDTTGVDVTAQMEQVQQYVHAVQMAQVEEYVKATQLAAYLDSLPKFYVDVAHWTAINRCEEGGTWNNDGWTSDGHFQGGLGMSVEAWNEVVAEAPSHGFTLPPSSNMATPYQQMQGAQILLNRVGPGGWACKA